MRNPEKYLGNPVRSLQTMLRSVSETDPRILPLIPDGVYGKNTYASVRSFQQVYDLPETGSVDGTTWTRISDTYHSVVPRLHTPKTIPFWSVETMFSMGEQNYHLYLVQAMLRVLADFFPALQPPEVNGILDQATADGLRWLQRAAELPETGSLDTETWHVLNGIYRVVTGDGRRIKQ